jgi:hypothetical protein
MVGNELTVVISGIHQNPLDEIVSVLITSNCRQSAKRQPNGPQIRVLTVNQWHPRAVRTAGADPRKIAVEEFGSTNLEALLHNL